MRFVGDGGHAGVGRIEYDVTDNNSVYFDDDDDGDDDDPENANSCLTSSPFSSACSTRAPALKRN